VDTLGRYPLRLQAILHICHESRRPAHVVVGIGAVNKVADQRSGYATLDVVVDTEFVARRGSAVGHASSHTRVGGGEFRDFFREPRCEAPRRDLPRDPYSDVGEERSLNALSARLLAQFFGTVTGTNLENVQPPAQLAANAIRGPAGEGIH
jgi:hypothetical protein